MRRYSSCFVLRSTASFWSASLVKSDFYRGDVYNTQVLLACVVFTWLFGESYLLILIKFNWLGRNCHFRCVIGSGWCATVLLLGNIIIRRHLKQFVYKFRNMCVACRHQPVGGHIKIWWASAISMYLISAILVHLSSENEADSSSYWNTEQPVSKYMTLQMSD